MATRTFIKNFMLEELDGKRKLESRFDTRCSVCRETIYQGNNFMFFGDKQKMCMDCYDDLVSSIEREL